jgi:hypothetical protein
VGIAFDQIDDAVQLTQKKLIAKGSFLDLQTDLTDHVAVREIWKGKAKKFEGGEAWKFQVQTDHNHSARFVGLYETDVSALTDTMAKGEVAPRHVNAHYIYDLHEQDFQRGGLAIADLVFTRVVAMHVSLFELMEEALWSKPTDSNDVLTPYGIAFWIVRNATEGFNGGNPTGFSAGRAGLSSTTYSRWKNWTAQYTDVSKTDLLRKMRTAHRSSQFRSPLSHAQPSLGSMGNGIYTGNDVIGLLEELLEAQNMNLGNDLASKDGRAMFKGTPVTYVPKLDSDAQDPVYMIDWKWIQMGIMAGWENNLTKPYMLPNKHNVRRVDLDASMNMICTNLRRQAVISKA